MRTSYSLYVLCAIYHLELLLSMCVCNYLIADAIFLFNNNWYVNHIAVFHICQCFTPNQCYYIVFLTQCLLNCMPSILKEATCFLLLYVIIWLILVVIMHWQRQTKLVLDENQLLENTLRTLLQELVVCSHLNFHMEFC